MEQDVSLAGQVHRVDVYQRSGRMLVRIDGTEHTATLSQDLRGGQLLHLDGEPHAVMAVARGESAFVWAAGRHAEVIITDLLVSLQGGDASEADAATAPMPGVVIAVHVGPGDVVRRGQKMLTIESMKLQTDLLAWRDGSVATVAAKPGQTFERGAQLLTLAPAEGAP